MISAIFAISKNGVIGASGDLPWYISADLIRFRKLTKGHTVVMGRKTWNAVINRIGKPLPDRTSVVLTRDQNFAPQGAVVTHDVASALAKAEGGFVIGGAEIYKQVMPYIDRLYVTEVDAEVDGDTYFPEFDRSQWHEISRESFPAGGRNEYPYTFLVFERNDEPKQL